MLSLLTKIANEFNIAVFITNQVVSDPGATAMFISGKLLKLYPFKPLTNSFKILKNQLVDISWRMRVLVSSVCAKVEYFLLKYIL